MCNKINGINFRVNVSFITCEHWKSYFINALRICEAIDKHQFELLNQTLWLIYCIFFNRKNRVVVWYRVFSTARKQTDRQQTSFHINCYVIYRYEIPSVLYNLMTFVAYCFFKNENEKNHDLGFTFIWNLIFHSFLWGWRTRSNLCSLNALHVLWDLLTRGIGFILICFVLLTWETFFYQCSRNRKSSYIAFAINKWFNRRLNVGKNHIVHLLVL